MQHLNDIKGKEIVPGYFGRFVHGEKITLFFVDIKKGSSLPEHQHPHERGNAYTGGATGNDHWAVENAAHGRYGTCDPRQCAAQCLCCFKLPCT